MIARTPPPAFFPFLSNLSFALLPSAETVAGWFNLVDDKGSGYTARKKGIIQKYLLLLLLSTCIYTAKKKGSNKSIFLRFEKQLTLTEGKSFLSFLDTRHQIKVWQKVKMNVSNPLTSGSHGRTLIMFGEYAC
jgi:hypothetical protein